MHQIFLGIGTNMGNREANLCEAVTLIGISIGEIKKVSSVYETEPWGFEAENNFLNMTVEVVTTHTPSGVLGAILMIEAQLGRIRTEKQYSSRVIDIDILFFDDLIMDEITLKIPHPYLHERKFVLFPLNEIAPDFIHPVLKQSVGSLLKSCEDLSEVRLQDRTTARPHDNQSNPLSAKL
ncbi:MAG: 2-amino-4-hydroxy-6-hydroxymethyldihydropteridine diphosphokinase [Bacteroidales bacterium]|nr:2-amino-4-hydroxy-6-hydroxymethyldihydropteridine diphosphokinase [Bacteroidales bacterium]